MENKTTTIEYKGQTFQVILKEDTRVTTYLLGQPVYETFDQYQILREGVGLVAFVYDKDDVELAIRRMVDFPNEAEAIHCRFD